MFSASLMFLTFVANSPGPVTRNVCAQHSSNGDCCYYSNQVNVKWCRNATTQQEYYIYQQLHQLSSWCFFAYCVTTTSPSPIPCTGDSAWNDVQSRCSCKYRFGFPGIEYGWGTEKFTMFYFIEESGPNPYAFYLPYHMVTS